MTLSNYKIGTRLATGFVVLLLLLGILGVFSLLKMQTINGATTDMSKNWLPSVTAVDNMSVELNYLRSRQYRAVLDKGSPAALKAWDESRAALATAMAQYEPLVSEDAERQAYTVFKSNYAAYMQDDQKIRASLTSGQFDAAAADLAGDTRTHFETLSATARKLRDLNIKGANDSASQAEASYADARMLVVGLLVVGLVLGLLAAVLITRSITRPLSKAVDVVRTIVNGKLDVAVEVTGQDEVASLMDALQHMVASLKKAAEAAIENARIKQALDSVTTNVMIADADRNIVYLNPSQLYMLRQVESELRRELPQFNVNDIIGKNIDIFHKAPQHQQMLLSRLTSTHVGNISVGKLQFRLTMNPILDADGKRLGTVVEWLNRTNEVESEADISSVMSAATQGDFSKRMQTVGKSGFFLTLAETTNSLLQNIEDALSEVVKIFDALSKGDLTCRMQGNFAGMLGKVQQDSDQTVTRIADIVTQIREATDTINTASREIAVGNQNLSQRTEEQAASLEETASSMEELTGTVKQNASFLDKGTTMSIRLPLTLAILDGMSISVGQEVYVIPLTFIVESLQPSLSDINTLAGRGKVIHVRGEYLPLVSLHDVFNITEHASDYDQGLVIILEADGGKMALFVDDLLGQHQVVIKSLETNYRKVAGVSGATIMGDGRVALIIDVESIFNLSQCAKSDI
ncbi:chemotaxis protein CheW [Leeia oryzae]|uniref:chemotaxis protein CheW n=1 Tax=Leeia oryzae TaxID=356662 RepID=UPI00036D7F42|nr:chemotaxis protein CheW [Leeia oryzae]